MATYIGQPSVSQEWTLISSLSPSNVTTITSGALQACSAYRIVMLLTSSGYDTLALRFNSDSTAAHYADCGITPTAFNGHASAAQMIIATFDNVGTQTTTCIELLFNGKTPAVAGGTVGVAINSPLHALAGTTQLGGVWLGGNAQQISTFTLFTSGAAVTFSGKILIYGRSDLV